VACEDQPAPPPAPPPVKTAAPTPDKKETKTEKVTGEELAARTKGCFAAHDAGDERKMRDCYADDVKHQMVDSLPPMRSTSADQVSAQYQLFSKAFPDRKHELALILVNGDKVVTIGSLHAKNSGEFMGKPATNKDLGILFAQHVNAGDDGKAEEVDMWLDQTSMMGQLGLLPPQAAGHARPAQQAGTWGATQVVVAKSDQKEKDNLALYDKSTAAFNSHDAKATAELYADDTLFRDAAGKEDLNGKEALQKGLDSFYKMSSDVKAEHSWKWAAGDYVVSSIKLTGTFDGAMPSGPPPTKKPFTLQDLEVVKIADGKIKEHWIFGNSYKFAVDVGLSPPPEAPVAEGGEPAEGNSTKPATATPDKAAPESKPAAKVPEQPKEQPKEQPTQ
jgi:steroid delta-isomerase-like uncharacterized protein